MRHPRGNPGRFVRVSAACLAISLVFTGCKPNKRYDLLEAELRTRERELAETRAALDRSRTLNLAFQQSQGPSYPGGPVPVAGSGGGCPVREIALARGTGGVDDDGLPGDESLMVVIVPSDEDRSAVKVPGRATVAAWEVSPNGLKQPIGTWEISADQLRPTWRSGLIATGYFVPLQWQTFPTTTRVRIAARLTTTDGRVFETDRDVNVNPVPQAIPAVPAVLPYPAAPGVPYPAPPPGLREPVLPGTVPPGVPSVLPPGVEELPPPMGLPATGARLLPPVKQ